MATLYKSNVVDPYKKPDPLTKEKWDEWLKTMITPPKWPSAPNPNNNSNGIIYPDVPFVLGPQEVFVLTKYDDDLEESVVVGVFREHEQATKVGESLETFTWLVSKFFMNSEVVVDEVKE